MKVALYPAASIGSHAPYALNGAEAALLGPASHLNGWWSYPPLSEVHYAALKTSTHRHRVRS
jgi:hypothetical protein